MRFLQEFFLKKTFYHLVSKSKSLPKTQKKISCVFFCVTKYKNIESTTTQNFIKFAKHQQLRSNERNKPNDELRYLFQVSDNMYKQHSINITRPKNIQHILCVSVYFGKMFFIAFDVI